MKVPSTRPWFDEASASSISRSVMEILKSGTLVLGPYTTQLEDRFSNYCGVKHAIAVNSCTTAIEIVLRYVGIHDKEVIVPTNTFVTVANAVIENGGKLVLADINPKTLCLDPAEIEKRLTRKTKAVIVAHIAGLPCPDIYKIQDICRAHKLYLIEDAAHAHGAMIGGKCAGSLGNAGCFSFYATKVMTTGTGGMVTTDDAELAQFARCLRRFGAGEGLNHIVGMGNDWMMTEIDASLGLHQLEALESNLELRNRIAEYYYEHLKDNEFIHRLTLSPEMRHSYYKIPFLLSWQIDKYKLVDIMRTIYSIEIGSVYDPPIHLQPVYQKDHGYQLGMFPAAEDTLKRICCLPVYPQITDDELSYVVDSLRNSLRNSMTSSVDLCSSKKDEKYCRSVLRQVTASSALSTAK